MMRVAVFLADHTDAAQPLAGIADGIKLNHADTTTAIAKLIEARIVETRGSGYCLTREPGQVTMFDIVTSTMPISRISTCPLGLENHGPNLCPLHRRMDNAMLAIEQAFRRTTLAQLLVEPSESRPLCNFPRLG